jgi:hypothetical protein
MNSAFVLYTWAPVGWMLQSARASSTGLVVVVVLGVVVVVVLGVVVVVVEAVVGTVVLTGATLVVVVGSPARFTDLVVVVVLVRGRGAVVLDGAEMPVVGDVEELVAAGSEEGGAAALRTPSAVTSTLWSEPAQPANRTNATAIPADARRPSNPLRGTL